MNWLETLLAFGFERQRPKGLARTGSDGACVDSAVSARVDFFIPRTAVLRKSWLEKFTCLN